MEYEIIGDKKIIDFAPSSVQAEILQNITTILTTPKCSVPLNRNFGLSSLWLDDPLPVSQARMTAEIIQAITNWEPRARVTQVTYVADYEQGRLFPKVRVMLNDDVR